jgi:hypothetical protein
MYLLILCLFFIIFERLIVIVALSVYHMIRNLDRALLHLFSSVSVAIALWSNVFLGLDGFPCWKLSFSKNLYLCYGTLYYPWMSINVNVFLELVGLVPFTLQTEFGAEIEIWLFRWVIKRFPRRNRQILTEWHIIASSAMLWVIYVCSDVINEHVWSSWLHRLVSMAERIRRWTMEPTIRDRFPARFIFVILLFFLNLFWYPVGLWLGVINPWYLVIEVLMQKYCFII